MGVTFYVLHNFLAAFMEKFWFNLSDSNLRLKIELPALNTCKIKGTLLKKQK